MNVGASDRPPAPGTDLARLLHAWHGGDEGAFAEAIEHAYAELKRIAARRIGSDGAATLSATELVHEAVLGTMAAPMDFANRVHFLATMSLAMRSILVDHARARAADKRGGDWLRLSLSRIDAEDEAEPAIELLALEQALQQLETQVAQCRRRAARRHHRQLRPGRARRSLGEARPRAICIAIACLPAATARRSSDADRTVRRPGTAAHACAPSHCTAPLPRTTQRSVGFKNCDPTHGPGHPLRPTTRLLP